MARFIAEVRSLVASVLIYSVCGVVLLVLVPASFSDSFALAVLSGSGLAGVVTWWMGRPHLPPMADRDAPWARQGMGKLSSVAPGKRRGHRRG